MRTRWAGGRCRYKGMSLLRGVVGQSRSGMQGATFGSLAGQDPRQLRLKNEASLHAYSRPTVTQSGNGYFCIRDFCCARHRTVMTGGKS